MGFTPSNSKPYFQRPIGTPPIKAALISSSDDGVCTGGGSAFAIPQAKIINKAILLRNFIVTLLFLISDYKIICHNVGTTFAYATF